MGPLSPYKEPDIFVICAVTRIFGEEQENFVAFYKNLVIEVLIEQLVKGFATDTMDDLYFDRLRD